MSDDSPIAAAATTPAPTNEGGSREGGRPAQEGREARGGPSGGVPPWLNNKARCYIGNLTPDITEADVRAHFEKYFPKRIDMKGGYAFCEFEKEEDAKDAVSFMNNSNLLDRRIVVRPAGEPKARGERFERSERGPPGGDRGDRGGDRDFNKPAPLSGAPRQAYGFRVEIENIAPRTSWQDLKDYGRNAGASVKYADVYEGPSGKCGVISFGVEEDMRRAVTTLHETTLDGNVLRVFEDKTNSGPRGAPTKQYGAPGSSSGSYQSGPPRQEYGGGGYGQDRGYGQQERGGYGGRDSYSRDSYSRDSYSRDSYRGDPRDSYRRRSPSPRDREYRRRSRSPPRGSSGMRAPLPAIDAPMAGNGAEPSSGSSRHHGSSSGSRHHSSRSHRSRSRSRERESSSRRHRSSDRTQQQQMPLSPPPAPAAAAAGAAYDPYARRSSRSRSPPRQQMPYPPQAMPADSYTRR